MPDQPKRTQASPFMTDMVTSLLRRNSKPNPLNFHISGRWKTTAKSKKKKRILRSDFIDNWYRHKYSRLPAIMCRITQTNERSNRFLLSIVFRCREIITRTLVIRLHSKNRKMVFAIFEGRKSKNIYVFRFLFDVAIWFDGRRQHRHTHFINENEENSHRFD